MDNNYKKHRKDFKLKHYQLKKQAIQSKIDSLEERRNKLENIILFLRDEIVLIDDLIDDKTTSIDLIDSDIYYLGVDPDDC